MMLSVAIIGAGKVGSGLARAWAAGGITISAVASRTHGHAETLARELNTVAVSLVTAPSLADLTVLAVSDDSIETVAAALVAIDWRGKAVVHTSGALNREALRVLSVHGAMTGALHPAYPFASAYLSADTLHGITFTLESDHPRLTEWLFDLVTAAEGKPLTLRPDQKALYHAALVLTSNYTVTLFGASRALLIALGAEESAADAALLALLGGTLENLRGRRPSEALTGPLARGDIGTVEAHIKALADLPAIQSAYLALARLTLPLLVERGLDTGSMERLINKWEGS